MKTANSDATVLIVPGLRDHVPEHWQTLLATRLPRVHTVPPMGRGNLNCAARVKVIEEAITAIEGPILIVAHSGGCVMVAHWARVTAYANRVCGCLLATPPDFDQPMPTGYPTLAMLHEGGWLPVPRQRLPMRSLVAASRNDPLGSYVSVEKLAKDWGSDLIDLGEVGHLNPASGFGEWPLAETLIQRLATASLM